MSTTKNLVLFTSGFPYGYSESFLESEIGFLANAFDKIVIVPKNPNLDDRCRKLPSNCSVDPLIFAKPSFQWSWHFLHYEVLKELIRILSQKNSFVRIKVLLAEVLKAIQSIELIKRYIEYDKVSVFYSYWTDDSAIAFALLRKKYPRAKFISRAHGWDVYFERHEIPYQPLRPMISRCLDNTFFISENGLRYFRNISGVKPEYGTLGRLGTIQSNQIDVKAPISKVLQLVSCSSIIPLKRIELLIESLAILQIPFHWTHIGTGPLEDKIIRLAQTTLLAEQFTFKGQMSNQEVFDFYGKCFFDFLINVSSTEGIPVSMMEAMSFGIPCCGTNVGGVSEIIIDEHNGYLFEANPSPEDIAKKITNHYNKTSEETMHMRQWTYAFWQDNYNSNTNYTAFAEAIQQL